MNVAWPTYFLLAGIIIQSLVAFYVMLNKREGRTVWAFLLLSFAIILWQVIYIFQSNAIYMLHLDVESGIVSFPRDLLFNHSVATFDRLQYFAIGLIGPTFLYLVMSMFIGLEEKRDRILRVLLFSFPIVLYILNAYSIATATPMIHTRYTLNAKGQYFTYRGMAYWYNVAYNYAFIGLGFSILAWKSIKPSYILQRKQGLVFLGGTILALFGNIQAVFVPTQLDYDMTPVFLTVGSIFFAIGILKYKMFLIEPRTERALEGEASFDLSMGHGFVVYEQHPSYALEIFADMAKHSMQGLAFLPVPPQEVRNQHGLEQTPILQTGERSSPTVFAYSSRDERDYILYIADRFSRDASNTIILLSGLDNFIESSPESARDMLLSLKRIASDNQSRLLVSMPKDLAIDPIEEILSDFVEL